MRLVLRYQGYVHGRVVNQDGTPLPRFSINPEAYRDSTGAFRVSMEQAGTVRLLFEAPGLTLALREVKVPVGKDLDLEVKHESFPSVRQHIGTGDEVLELRLYPGAKVKGTLRLRVLLDTPERKRTLMRLQEVPLAGGHPDGTHLFEHVPAGHYTFLLLSEQTRERPEVHRETLDVAEGESVVRDVVPVWRPVR